MVAVNATVDPVVPMSLRLRYWTTAATFAVEVKLKAALYGAASSNVTMPFVIACDLMV